MTVKFLPPYTLIVSLVFVSQLTKWPTHESLDIIQAALIAAPSGEGGHWLVFAQKLILFDQRVAYGLGQRANNSNKGQNASDLGECFLFCNMPIANGLLAHPLHSDEPCSEASIFALLLSLAVIFALKWLLAANTQYILSNEGRGHRIQSLPF